MVIELLAIIVMSGGWSANLPAQRRELIVTDAAGIIVIRIWLTMIVMVVMTAGASVWLLIVKARLSVIPASTRIAADLTVW